MTTDLVNRREIEKAGTTASAALFRQLFGATRPNTDEVTAKAAFARKSDANETGAEAQKLKALLEQQEVEKDGLSRCMGATVALLKYAHKMIERAEETIQAQEGRIAQLEDLATTDDLTGLKNRRGFFESFMRELDKCDRGLSQGGLLVMIDLDNFKSVNDTCGHLAGDACLRLVARTLESEIRVMDVAARLGGDEFVLLLSNTSKECAAGRAQSLAWQLNHLSLAWYGEEIPVRASLGLRAYGAGDRADKIFNAADIALFASKQKRKEEAERL